MKAGIPGMSPLKKGSPNSRFFTEVGTIRVKGNVAPSTACYELELPQVRHVSDESAIPTARFVQRRECAAGETAATLGRLVGGDVSRGVFRSAARRTVCRAVLGHRLAANVPVNVLVGLDVLKAGYGWNDEELYDHFLYDLQVRYALGFAGLSDGDFELRTLYNFRRRLSQYNLEQGTNLLAAAFVDITDQQITALALRTGQQRMDSTQIASNIVIMSRLQLTVEAIQRLHRLLSEAERAQYAALLAPYVGETAGHYVYRVKGFAATEAQLQPVGQTLYALLQAMAASYGQEPAYQVAARLFGEQYRVATDTVQAKANQEIAASSLQSLDDLEATYRERTVSAIRATSPMSPKPVTLRTPCN